MLNQLPHHPDKIQPEAIAGLVGRPDPLLLEVGCHEGEDTAKMLAAMPQATVYCFEPDPRPIARFRTLFIDDSRVVLYRGAVTDKDGTTAFYPSTGKAGHSDDWDYSGSLRKPTGHLIRSPEIKFKPPIEVQCTRLDTWLADNPYIRMIDFIWIDVQGGQQALIAGGKLTLALTRFVYIECHQQPLYDGEPTQKGLVALLPGFGAMGVYEQDNILFCNKHFT